VNALCADPAHFDPCRQVADFPIHQASRAEPSQLTIVLMLAVLGTMSNHTPHDIHPITCAEQGLVAIEGIHLDCAIKFFNLCTLQLFATPQGV
jgi:hypothetical protein